MFPLYTVAKFSVESTRSLDVITSFLLMKCVAILYYLLYDVHYSRYKFIPHSKKDLVRFYKCIFIDML